MIKGLMHFVHGLRLLLSRDELRSVLWRMIALLVVVMLLLSIGTFWLVDYMTAMWMPEGDAWYIQLLGWLAGVLAFLLSVITGMLVYVVLGSAVAAPWLDMLAERTEAMHGKSLQVSEQPWSAMILQSLVNSLRPMLELLMWGAAALLFIWLPPLATALWAYGGIRFLSYELIDTSASRLGWDFAARKLELKSRRWFYLGFAGSALLLMLVPVINLLVIPAAVVGLSNDLASDKNNIS